MRIACLQFSPSLGDVTQNIQKAEAILQDAAPENLHLLMLPELAFSGYNFPSIQAITPYLEPTTSGASTAWAIKTALRLQCHVSVGYPEITSGSSPARYNSAVLVSPKGKVLVNYRKSFLYYTDETWADEGKEGFFTGDVEDLGSVAMGICMDINPYRFTSPWSSYEFANHALNRHSSIVLLTMAWLKVESSSSMSGPGNVPDLDTLSYWLNRFQPMIEKSSEEEVLIAMCNRCGREGLATYAGTSSVLTIKKGKVTLYGFLGTDEERLLVVDTENEDQPRWTLSSPQN